MDKKYNPSNIESKWYDYWMKNNIFHSKPDARKAYTVLIPPPNVTGILHMGHMLNNTIQDVLVRRARLLGFNACWIPGTDHASIATEAKVLKKLQADGIQKDDLSREEFIRHAWDWTEKHGGIILQQLKRLGASCDWERVKFTMDQDMYDSVIQAFVEMYNKGFIYRGQKMINWDPKAQTAISDEEVIYKEQNSNLYYITYKLLDSSQSITISTTRPETILGDTAICVHPNDDRYKSLIGQQAIVPLINRVIPIITDDYIDPEFGTGALKVTPAHDLNDYSIGQKNNLEVVSVIDKDGCISSEGKLYVGEDRFTVRKKIIKDIDLLGQLVKVESIINKVGFSERTNVVIEPRLSTQWFMKMDQLCSPAIKNVLNDNIQFYPKKTINTYKYWMENIRDWCLSRQLWWGHRIPAFYYNKSEYVVAIDKEEALVLAKEKSGNSSLKISDLKQDEDVLDTWFSSWLWPLTVFDGLKSPDNSDFNYYYPTNDLVTGPDILFFWVARMIMAGYCFTGNLPFHNVYFTGIVRDKDRRKMSKSLGNSPDPIKLIDLYGADGVRVAMLFSSPAGNDLLFDESLCVQGRNFSNKIWNAYRLIDTWEEISVNLNSVEELAIVWFKNKLIKDIESVSTLFKEFRISDALMVLYKLIWDDFCSCYLELIKPTDKKISKEAYKQTIYFFETLLVCLHPFMPFITEDIWHKIRNRKDEESISLCHWPQFNVQEINSQVLLDFEYLFKLIGAIRKIRKEKNIAFSQSIKLLVEKSDQILYPDILKKMCNLEGVELFANQKDQLFSFLVDTNKYFIPLDFSVDVEEEVAKINNQIDYLNGFLDSIDKKVSNESFIKNAPRNIVEMELRKKDDTITKINSLHKQLKAFNEKR